MEAYKEKLKRADDSNGGVLVRGSLLDEAEIHPSY